MPQQQLRFTEWWHSTLQRPRSCQEMGFSSALRRRRHETHHRTICSRYGLSAPGTTTRHVRGTFRACAIRTHGSFRSYRVQAGCHRPLGQRSITERAGFEPAGAFTPCTLQAHTIDHSDIFPYGRRGIRTPGRFRASCSRDRRIRPLCQPSITPVSICGRVPFIFLGER